MLRIDRLQIQIKTENGVYGIDTEFSKGLNFVSSEDNTCGKSSVLSAIYYCLGFEEIIGGRGERVLTSVFKTAIEDGDKSWPVLESGAYLEISNYTETVTIFRSAKSITRDCKLMSVYYSTLENIYISDTICEEMYVHMPNSATSTKGFHNFLEKFLYLELPLVPSSDDFQRKLYLQLIFSSMFIEQKHGWGDILAGMPILGIKDAKKRVLEFVMHLDTLDNEKMKVHCRNLENSIKSNWDSLSQDVIRTTSRESCKVNGWPRLPCILNVSDLSRITVCKSDVSLQAYIDNLKEQYDSTKQLRPKIIDNFEALQIELEETETAITTIEGELVQNREKMHLEKGSIKSINDNLEIIDADIRNNKDAARLRKLGADLSCSTFIDICPVCNQPIQDSLFPLDFEMPVMSIDENIRHLEAQKDMLDFALQGHRTNQITIENYCQEIEAKLFTLRRLAKAIRSDIFSTNEELSETIIIKRINLETEINNLSGLIGFFEESKRQLQLYSTQWEDYLVEKSKIPTKKFSDMDQEKIQTLRSNFIMNLSKYGYKSIANIHDIGISDETYLPIVQEFDMKFDSSASDNIRAIWAFTLALMQTSIEKSGNHPCVLIFDEPDQHSIVTKDMEQFFRSVIDLRNVCQVIIGITIKDSDIKQSIEQLPADSFAIFVITEKAFKKML